MNYFKEIVNREEIVIATAVFLQAGGKIEKLEEEEEQEFFDPHCDIVDWDVAQHWEL